ncbi:hypothetical protein [Ornithinimicrobium pratense]|uniref:hypothetical protein n=1 Tax=Ornithinimicrobium pratense TaxID=2593973 RepID=UPI00307EF5AD
MTDYDDFARAYSNANETNLLNAWYERPAMLELGGTWTAAASSTPAAGLVPSPPPCASGVPS